MTDEAIRTGDQAALDRFRDCHSTHRGFRSIAGGGYYCRQHRRGVRLQPERTTVRRVLVALIPVEPKDGYPDPDAAEVGSRLTDVLNDVTKHDEVIGWRVSGQVQITGDADGPA